MSSMAVHFSSATDQWATPQAFYDEQHAIYRFTLDVCADASNAKCPRYFTKEINGLAQSWAGARCWMNPPYGREIGHWVRKAAHEVMFAEERAELVVCLLPARTDTKWFHEWCLPLGKVTFLKGRLKFGDAKASAPFPSMLVVFGGAR